MIYKHKPLSSHFKDRLRHYLEDIIYGANDGIVTTFTVISGVKGAKLAPVIMIILGFVNLSVKNGSALTRRSAHDFS